MDLNTQMKQYKNKESKKLYILQSYVFKPDIFGGLFPPKKEVKSIEIKLPAINHFKKKNIKIMQKSEKIREEKLFQNKSMDNQVLRKLKLKESIKNLKFHLKDPSEYLNRKTFHKSKFVINKEGQENINHLKNIFKEYINHNKFYKNEEIQRFPEYEKTSILNMEQLKLSEKLAEDQNLMMQNYGWPTGNIKKNRLLLESLFLKRLELKEKSDVFKINTTFENDQD